MQSIHDPNYYRLACEQQHIARHLYARARYLRAVGEHDEACCCQVEAAIHSRIARTVIYVTLHPTFPTY